MAVPDFQSFLLPLLQFASDDKIHNLSEARENLARVLELSNDDLNEMLPSGTQRKFYNRVAWAKVYLERAGLVTSPKRAHFRITDRGKEVLRDKPKRIDIKFLSTFPAFKEFHTGKGKKSAGKPKLPSDVPPEETLDNAYQEIRGRLMDEIVTTVKQTSPAFFERLVVELLVRMGYGGSRSDAGHAVGKIGDEGIDGIINEDRLGLDVVYIQAKRWEGTVGRPELQKFVGALHGKRAKKGVFLTTGDFSSDARDYVKHIDPRIVLIDGKRLAGLMLDFKVGVSTVNTYEILKVDTDFFEEG